MSSYRSYRSVNNRYRQSTNEIQECFQYLPKLTEEFSWEVCLSYMFAKVELAHNMALYGGAVKLHCVDRDLANKAIQIQHLTRECFQTFFSAIFGKKIPSDVSSIIEVAQRTRDKVLHGKWVRPAEMRVAIVKIIEYAEVFNNLVNGAGGFRPFGSLKGFKGRGKSLPKSTSRLVLKGLGFDIS